MIWGCNFGISLTNCKRINLSLMKNSFYLILLVISLLFQFSCTEESVTDEFQDANGNVEEKLIRSVSYVSPEHPEDNITVNFSYNNDGSLNTVSDGTDTSIFLYEDNELNTITGSNDNLTMEELYQSPYDAFEIGQVVSYDENGNPEIIEFFEEEYDSDFGDYITKVYTAILDYDDAPNPFYYTTKAAGFIDVLDDVQLNFSLTPQSPEIVQARLLYPVNNLSQIIYKNEEGETIYSVNANFDYDEDNYPTSATITAVSVVDSDQGIVSVVFTYED